MKNLYAIYSYKFIETNEEGDWTQGEQVTVTDIDAAQDWFYRLFGNTQTLFRVQKGEGDTVWPITAFAYHLPLLRGFELWS